MVNKRDLRRSLLQTRQQMSPEIWKQTSDRLCQQIRSWPPFAQANTVLTYLSIRNEPDLSPLWDTTTHRWGIPRCEGQHLVWHHWSPQDDTALLRGKFGIAEPHPAAPQVSAAEVDLILIPAVACDQRGFRLGYGGGFYDRLLSQPEWRTKPTVGIVFEFARLPLVPTDPWDLPLQAVCTEAGVFLSHSSGG